MPATNTRTTAPSLMPLRYWQAGIDFFLTGLQASAYLTNWTFSYYLKHLTDWGISAGIESLTIYGLRFLWDKWRARHEYFLTIAELINAIEFNNDVIRYQLDGVLPADVARQNQIIAITGDLKSYDHVRVAYEQLLLYLAYTANQFDKHAVRTALNYLSLFSATIKIETNIKQQRLYLYHYDAKRLKISAHASNSVSHYLQTERGYLSAKLKGFTLYDLIRIVAAIVGLVGYTFNILTTRKQQSASYYWAPICLAFTLAPLVLNAIFNPVDRPIAKFAHNIEALKQAKQHSDDMVQNLRNQSYAIKDLFTALGIGYDNIQQRLTNLNRKKI
jgi:hypothetical protein